MPDYMLLLHERPELFEHVSPDEMQRVIAKYVDWRTTLAGQGRLAGGNKLRDDAGRVLEPRGDRIETRDGPFTETKEVIGGYFIVSARDYAEAASIAEACPHLMFGGRIELREIEPT